MKKLTCFGLLTLFITLWFGCAGMPQGSDSIDNLSLLLNRNTQTVELEKVSQENNTGLSATWKAENNEASSYSVVRFDENGNFSENVYTLLTHELLASYEGTYNENPGVLEIQTGNEEVYIFHFILDGNQLKLFAK